MKELQDGAIYSLALTPHQYTAKRVPDTDRYRAANIAWVLMPEWPENQLLCGPILFVLKDGTIARAEGRTPATVHDLNFTGRYQHEPANTNTE